MRLSGRREQLHREFPVATATASVLAQCRSGMARTGYSGDYVVVRPLLRTLENLADASGCKAAFIAYSSAGDPPHKRVIRYREALDMEPESWNAWSSYASALGAAEKHHEAAAALVDGISRSSHPVHTLSLQLQLVGQRALAGDSARAGRLLDAIGRSVSRDGRPYLRWLFIEELHKRALHAGNVALWKSLAHERAMIARKAGAAAAEFFSIEHVGGVLAFQVSEPKAAIVELTRAVALARAIGAPEFIASVYRTRGRAHAAAGAFREAERDLQTALGSVPVNESTQLAELHHDLAHVYEGQGRWRDAAREMDLYRHRAWDVREGSAIYMMSLRDGGVIRWKAGWHAAARKSFEEMVRVIDARQENHFYAGEYYERIGDFSRAASYYERGVRSSSTGDRHLNLAGLTRMYLALGLRDSARATATLHDRPGLYSVSRILPAVLVADGRVDEGLALARIDVAEREAKGSPQIATTARLQLARLLLDAGRPGDAEREAASAERLAASLNLTEQLIDAIHVQGVAQLRERTQASIATLLRARMLVRAHPTPAAALKVESALGEAFAAFGRNAEALAAYDGAAKASEHVIANYESALDRARYREQRIAPFDGALRVVLRMSESPYRSGLMLSWSARKKKAILSHEGKASNGTGALPTLATVQRALGAGAALVDYLVLDSAVVAHVITPQRSRLVSVPLSVTATSEMLQRLTRPLAAVEGGNLDLARAPFDLRLAQRLYAGLFAPIEALIDGAQRIVIAPDGPLHGVPFSALPRQVSSANVRPNAYHAASYLIDRYNITLVASPAVDMSAPPRIPATAARILVVRGSVVGGAREVHAIVDAWPARRVFSLEGAAATESGLRNAIGGSSVVHFAVHALADVSDPLAAYLELSRAGVDDGLLHVSEVSALKFRGDLVVLTSCQTMPGPMFAGSGPFGIANSFIAAGARNVIATHWLVGESAAEISRDLHRGLARGETPSEALRAAQLKFRRDSLRAHPFFWGGYGLIAGTSQ